MVMINDDDDDHIKGVELDSLMERGAEIKSPRS